MRFQLLSFVAAIAACSGSGSGKATTSASGQRTFPTPDSAVQAVFHALATNDTTLLMDIMGPDSRPVVMQADQVQAARERQVVATAMMEKWALEGEGNTRTIVVGNEGWPMPIPLVEENGAWRFNTVEGEDELFFRRIGRNELAIIDVAHAFVDAQKEYATKSHDGVPKGAYAQRILSDSGKQNGLYWRSTDKDRDPSPMGELAAKAAGEGYGQGDPRHDPFHGYYMKVLKEQGAGAPGGAKSWIASGAMRGGFGLLAWPAEYGTSGIMTFMVGPDGVLRQKDLGENTAALVTAMTAFDPDSTWTATAP